MRRRRAFFDAVMVDSHSIVALGGISGAVSESRRLETSASSAVELFDMRNNTWMDLPSMTHGRCLFTAHVLGGNDIYVIGGQCQLSHDTANLKVLGMDKFSFDRYQWTQNGMLAGTKAKRSAHSSCVL